MITIVNVSFGMEFSWLWYTSCKNYLFSNPINICIETLYSTSESEVSPSFKMTPSKSTNTKLIDTFLRTSETYWWLRVDLLKTKLIT